nr:MULTISPECIES: phage tail protein [Vibrio]
MLNDNQTDFEFAFEQSLKKLVESEDIYLWLTDPQKTDAALLDIMAAEAGVSDWFASDLESDKRDSIEKATLIHQKAGTREGIKQALEALGCRATVSKGEKPYSLYIHNLVTNKPLTVDLQNRLYERVINNKSERDTFELIIGRLWLGTKYRSAQLSVGRRIKIEAA